MGERMTLKKFDSLKLRDFENGAVINEIRGTIKLCEELLYGEGEEGSEMGEKIEYTIKRYCNGYFVEETEKFSESEFLNRLMKIDWNHMGDKQVINLVLHGEGEKVSYVARRDENGDLLGFGRDKPSPTPTREEVDDKQLWKDQLEGSWEVKKPTTTREEWEIWANQLSWVLLNKHLSDREQRKAIENKLLSMPIVPKE